MKILINCSTLKKGGVLQVGHSLVSELLQRSDHEYFYIISSALQKDFHTYIENDSNHFFAYDVKPSVFLSLTGKEEYLNDLLRQINPDVVFSVFGPTYWKPKCLHVSGYAKASYFYPDSPFIKQLPLFRRMKLFVLKQFHMNDFKRFNNALVTETNDASNRLSRILPGKKIFTVSNTFNQIFNMPDLWENSVELPMFNGLTLLSITANYRHKNLNIIPGVISYLAKTYPSFKFRFVLTLKKSDFKDLEEEFSKYIIFLGRISIYQCPSLYMQSDIMFMPTLLECFSATYPEAMRMGVPILTSDLPFARDVCGDAAVYFDPMSPMSIGEAIYSIANNQSMRSDIKRKAKKRLQTFETSESRAQKYVQILETLYETDYSKS